MRKIFTILSVALITTIQVYAQCSDLSSYTNAGIYPGDALEFCDQASANQDLVIVAKEDTTIDPFSATVNRVRIDNITNLPSGMTYTCGSPNCEYTPSNGLIKICITFSGNINDASYGTDSPVITGDINFTSGNITTDLNDQTLPYDFQFTVLDAADASCTPTSTSNYRNNEINIYPNPVSSNGRLNFSEVSTVEIIDFLGNTVYAGTIDSSLDLSQFNLNAGVYFIRANSSLGQTTQKFVVK